MDVDMQLHLIECENDVALVMAEVIPPTYYHVYFEFDTKHKELRYAYSRLDVIPWENVRLAALNKGASAYGYIARREGKRLEKRMYEALDRRAQRRFQGQINHLVEHAKRTIWRWCQQTWPSGEMATEKALRLRSQHLTGWYMDWYKFSHLPEMPTLLMDIVGDALCMDGVLELDKRSTTNPDGEERYRISLDWLRQQRLENNGAG
jgi:hypothetical protein